MPLTTLARLVLALFGISTCFPLVAAVLNSPDPPRALGLADVAIAAVLVTFAGILHVRASPLVTDRDLVRAWRAMRHVWSIIPILLIVFFLAGSRISWQVLVIGLGWRFWMFVALLPEIAAARASGVSREDSVQQR
jgi:hypothetical protein